MVVLLDSELGGLGRCGGFWHSVVIRRALDSARWNDRSSVLNRSHASTIRVGPAVTALRWAKPPSGELDLLGGLDFVGAFRYKISQLIELGRMGRIILLLLLPTTDSDSASTRCPSFPTNDCLVSASVVKSGFKIVVPLAVTMQKETDIVVY